MSAQLSNIFAVTKPIVRDTAEQVQSCTHAVRRSMPDNVEWLQEEQDYWVKEWEVALHEVQVAVLEDASIPTETQALFEEAESMHKKWKAECKVCEDDAAQKVQEEVAACEAEEAVHEAEEAAQAEDEEGVKVVNLPKDEAAPACKEEEESRELTPTTKPAAKPAAPKRLEFQAMRAQSTASPSAHSSVRSMEVVIPVKRKHVIQDDDDDDKDMTNEDDEPEHKVPCKRCANFFKWCTGLPNRVCGPCRKAKAKCEKSSGRGGKGGGESKDKGKAPARPQPKLRKKAPTCETIEVSDDKEREPGPSKPKGKHKASVSGPTEELSRGEEWALVASLQSRVHNTISRIRGMEGDLVGLMRELAELKEAMADK